MKKTISVLWLLLFSISEHAYGNVPTVGNDFVFTIFNAVFIDEGGVLMYAIVSNNNNGPAHVTMTSLYANFSTVKVTVAPFSIFKIRILPFSIEAQYMDGGSGQIVVENKGMRLISDLPVTVYTHVQSYGEDSADTFLVIPAVQLGTQYVAVTCTFPTGSWNMIAVVAYQDNTQITIGKQTVTLNALQVASVSSLLPLSGTAISGNKPFGAFSGSTCGVTNQTGGCDYEAVMLHPVSTWGTQFTAIPFMYLNTNYYQVLSNTNNTVVSMGSTPIATLNIGEHRIFQSGVAQITSNNPIQLIQIGQNIGLSHHYIGDPFFLLLPSADQMSNASVLLQPTGFGFDLDYQFFIRIVTVTAGTGEIQLDGATISALQYRRVPNSHFYYYEAKVSNATHSIRTTNAAIQFTAISYSYGWYEGCGFVGALTLPIGNI